MSTTGGSGYQCGYCGCWHNYSYEMCKDLTTKAMSSEVRVPCWECQGKSIEIDRLTEELAEVKRTYTGKWFQKGRESVLRKNQSGCCCLFNEDDEIEGLCMAHKVREDELQDKIKALEEEEKLSTIELREENDKLKVALNNATENRWGEWEVERANVKGDNMAKEFRIIDLEQENAKLNEELLQWKKSWEMYEAENAKLRERLKGIEKLHEDWMRAEKDGYLGKKWVVSGLNDEDEPVYYDYTVEARNEEAWQAIKKASDKAVGNET